MEKEEMWVVTGKKEDPDHKKFMAAFPKLEIMTPKRGYKMVSGSHATLGENEGKRRKYKKATTRRFHQFTLQVDTSEKYECAEATQRRFGCFKSKLAAVYDPKWIVFFKINITLCSEFSNRLQI